MAEVPSCAGPFAVTIRTVLLGVAFALATASVACAPAKSVSIAEAPSTHSANPATSGPADADGGCSKSFAMPNRKPVGSRSGTLLPPGAAEAVVCTYFSREGVGNLPLTEVTAVRKDLDGLAGYLNDLPEAAVSGSDSGGFPWGGAKVAGACSLMNSSVYRIVVTYPDQITIAVNVLPTCAVVERDGIVRQLERFTTLRDYWRG